MKPAVVQYVEDHKPKTIEDVKRLIQDYFNFVTWSLEKEEYERMSDEEKEQFSQRVFESI